MVDVEPRPKPDRLLLWADACLVVGFLALIAGAGWQFGPGWAAMLGGSLLVWVGWRAYRGGRKHEAV